MKKKYFLKFLLYIIIWYPIFCIALWLSEIFFYSAKLKIPDSHFWLDILLIDILLLGIRSIQEYRHEKKAQKEED